MSMLQTKWTSMDDTCNALWHRIDIVQKKKTLRTFKTLEAFISSFFNSIITFLAVSLTQFFGQINLSATNEPLFSYLVMADFFKNLFDFFFQSASCDNDKKPVREKLLDR